MTIASDARNHCGSDNFCVAIKSLIVGPNPGQLDVCSQPCDVFRHPMGGIDEATACSVGLGGPSVG